MPKETINFNGYVDSTGQFGRITTYMKDIETDRMENIEADLREAMTKIFPKNDTEQKLQEKHYSF